MGMKAFARTLVFMLLLMAATAFAYDGDMDIYHEFKEELALVRDGYVACLNMAMEDAGGKPVDASTWKRIEYEAPAKEQLPHITVEEIPNGFRISGAHGAYKVDAKVRVLTRETDVYYEVQFAKGSNGPGKEIFGEVFRNDK